MTEFEKGQKVQIGTRAQTHHKALVGLKGTIKHTPPECGAGRSDTALYTLEGDYKLKWYYFYGYELEAVEDEAAPQPRNVRPSWVDLYVDGKKVKGTGPRSRTGTLRADFQVRINGEAVRYLSVTFTPDPSHGTVTSAQVRVHAGDQIVAYPDEGIVFEDIVVQ